MRKEQEAALDVLARASDVHNCWAILDDAVTSGDDDQFTKEYIEDERELLEDSIKSTIRALGALSGLYGIVISTQNDNGSYAYMRKVRDEHLTELERAAEFDRGYRAGQRAMDAERQAIALKLRGLDLTGSSHENLSKIAYAIYPCATGWTPESCEGLRDQLVRLLGGVNERETTLTTCDVLDNERHKAIAELRKFEPMIGGKPTEETSKLIRCITGKSDSHVACINDLEETRDRIIHLLGGDTCNCDQGGDHGDCARCCRAGAAGGDTDVDEPAEIRAISNEIADLLLKMDAESDAVGTCPNDVPTPSITDELREMDNGHSRTCPKSGDEVSESAPSVSIVDELRDCVERATKTYDDAAWYEVDDEDEHTWCSITVAEIDGIADRIEEQFARVCQQQEAVLLKQMDQQRAMLTEQRDAARAKVIALCNECDKLKRAADRDADHIESLSGAYNDMERERDELQAKLDGIKSVLATDETEASDAC